MTEPLTELQRQRKNIAEVRARLNPKPKPVFKPAVVAAPPAEAPAPAPEIPPLTLGEGPSIKRIQVLSAKTFGVTVAIILGKSRRGEFTIARHVAMYFCRKLTPATNGVLGLAFGGKDGATLRHAERRISKMRATKPDFDQKLIELERQILS